MAMSATYFWVIIFTLMSFVKPTLITGMGQEHVHNSGASQKQADLNVTPHPQLTPSPVNGNISARVSQTVAHGSPQQEIAEVNSAIHALSGNLGNSGNGNANGRTPSPLGNILSSLLGRSSPAPPSELSTEGSTGQPVPLLSGLMCYDEGPLIVQKNMACQEKGLRKANLTGEILAELLRSEGGGLIGGLISQTLPDHLRGSGSLAQHLWVNHNKSEIISSLQELVHDRRQHQNSIKQNIGLYLSKGDFTHILATSAKLVESLRLNLISKDGSGNSSSQNEIVSEMAAQPSSCAVLVTEVNNLRSIYGDLQGILMQPSDNVVSVHTSDDNLPRPPDNDNNSENSGMSSAVLDRKIDELLQKVKSLEESCRSVLLLHYSLLNATISFHEAVVTFEQELLQNLTQSSLNPSLQPAIINETISSKESVSRNSSSTSNISDTEQVNNYKAYFSNSTSIIEILSGLKSDLGIFKDLIFNVNLTMLEKDTRIETWTSLNTENRRKRSITGFSISGESCVRQGGIINQTNYISLCSICTHTSVLDEDYFPRYLTERVCDRGTSSNPSYQNSCLNLPGQGSVIPAGICQQQHIHVIVLRKTPGRCMKVRSQGHEVITDQWESTTHPLRVGCECVINQNSPMANLAFFP